MPRPGSTRSVQPRRSHPYLASDGPPLDTAVRGEPGWSEGNGTPVQVTEAAVGEGEVPAGVRSTKDEEM